MSRPAESSDLGQLAIAFRAQSRRRVAERIPLGLAILLVCAFTGAALEWIHYPDRRMTLALTDVLFLFTAGLINLITRWRVDLSIVIAVIGVNAIGIGSNLYHWSAGASAERSLLIVTALCSIVVIILPWGWRAQALGCFGPVATYIATVLVSGTYFGHSGGLTVDGPLSVLIVYPLIVVGLSVVGAELTERYVRSDFVLTRALRERELKLAQAKEMAEDASRTKTDFLASMSHEIRTPINVIFGMTDMALDSELTADQRSYLRRTRGAANTLLVLVNDILDFAKIEARKLRLTPRAFGLRSWLDQTLNPLSWSADDDVPDILLGDVERLAQVVMNLVANAIQFTADGTVQVRVTRAAGATERQLLHFQVIDTGVGIPLGQQREIFEAFVQGESARVMRTGGAGLGLAICARLVRLMDGRIWVESEPGRGSSFQFTARLMTAAHEAADEEAMADSVAA